MIALISPAKTMRNVPNEDLPLSEPRFLDTTHHLVENMMGYSVEQLGDIFKVSDSIARELKSRFGHFFDPIDIQTAAIDSYDGVVYKHIKESLDRSRYPYLNQTVRISSLLYGLLRPFDAILPYRMEGFIRISHSDSRIDRYWRDIQTEVLINDVQSAGGTLLYLASKEEQNAFNWKEVLKQVRVVDIQFLQYKGDKLRQVVIYTKMARGQMIRYMAQNSINSIEMLKRFEWGGYVYSDSLSSEDKMVWIMY